MPLRQPPTVLITGATDGLGRGLAVALARRGATVLVHGRSAARIAATVSQVRATGAGEARGYRADFSSLAGVHALADQVAAAEPRLDVLINNAGIGADVPGGTARLESADGFELRFAVNYLSTYLLSHRLLDLLRRSAPARVINVSSAGQTPIDFTDVMLTRGYGGRRAYCQSKLAQIMFTFDLAAELQGSGVAVNALHPATYMPTKIVSTPISTIADGVEAVSRLALDADLDGVTGRYFDQLREAQAHPAAYDEANRACLRSLSAELTNRSPV